MAPAFERSCDDLEARATEARHAYVAALVAWEKAAHRLSKLSADGAYQGVRDDSAAQCHEAQQRKEICRIALRDVIDELGYVPEGFLYGTALPSEPDLDG